VKQLPCKNHDKNPKILASEHHKYSKCYHHHCKCNLSSKISRILVHLQPTLILQFYFFSKINLTSFHWLPTPTRPKPWVIVFLGRGGGEEGKKRRKER
jgi:hypothetical protein